MAYINLAGGLKINTADAVDARLVLSKNEMLTMHYDDTRPAVLAGKIFQLPDHYLCVCSDDGKVYLYDSANEESEETGKFTLFDPQGVALVKVTYSELVALRNNSELIPGVYYRITDYETTTVQENTQSAGHQFDIIVTADSADKLNENARAIQHEGDTYFANSKLGAWKLKYCLDNDTSRFAWADEVNGKGVIYRMVDEWNNDCPYDFKNMMFLVESGDYIYTFYYYNDYEAEEYDLSLNQYMLFEFPTGEYTTTEIGCHTNIIKPYYNQTDGSDVGQGHLQFLNFITFRNFAEPDGEAGLRTYCCYSNFFDFGCRNISFDKCCSLNSFGCDCRDITFGDNCNYNRFGKNNHSNIFGDGCESNTFGGGCWNNTFDNNCYNNTFDYGCESNTFGNNCTSNTVGKNCRNNTFGDNYNSNTFGNYCRSNTFGNDCANNTFGSNCQSNTFGNNCQSNTFGNSCLYNTFGSNCSDNTFGNGCYSNTFGTGCNYNTFGSDCQYLQISDSSGIQKSYIHVENGTQGASSANRFDLYDPAILNKDYQVTFKRTPSGKYLMLWATDTGTMTGKVKDSNIDTTWEDIE